MNHPIVANFYYKESGTSLATWFHNGKFRFALERDALINLDDPGHLSFLLQHVGLPKNLSLRYNPGALREGNAIIGQPQEAKFGMTAQQMVQCYTCLLYTSRCV